jgi:protocatechuate 3,4-dioxygenase, alpha subunit
MTRPQTPSQTVGPYYAIGLCRRPETELIDPADRTAVELTGVVYDGEDEPIGDAVVELWDAFGGRWGRAGTDADGRFRFTIAKPEPSNGDAPHLHVYVFARGLLKHQLTRIYFPDEKEANASDAVLSAVDEDARETLVARPDGGSLRFDIRMQGDSATVFFAL